ncbi:MAG: phosphatase PAP2 family protein [Deltaproteobacteria bacterium]|nr:phosphatase PAP2 family protein [Deltaproteobacteria bacterium]
MRFKAVSILVTVFLLDIFSGVTPCRGEAGLTVRLERDAAVLKNDYKRFYLDADNILCLLAGGMVPGILANTDMDREFREYYRENLKNRWTDNTSKVFKVPGELFLTAPLLFGAHLVLDETTPVGEWVDKSLRALLVGGPGGLVIQRLTGAGRPDEGGSHWKPFEDSNGLSGHAFVGAVPFITAARMQDDPYMKALYYALSVLPAASRVNDDKHYLSQALFGWYLAYLSVDAVDRADGRDDLSFFITPAKNNGIMFQANFAY